jgi:hypothetical protein
LDGWLDGWMDGWMVGSLLWSHISFIFVVYPSVTVMCIPQYPFLRPHSAFVP